VTLWEEYQGELSIHYLMEGSLGELYMLSQWGLCQKSVQELSDLEM